jgi:predicted small metal-binding protein
MRRATQKAYTKVAILEDMASMLTCPCGWTIISPQGAEEVKKHTKIHIGDIHPGMTMTEEEIGKIIRTV